jgi:hypothetical protein
MSEEPRRIELGVLPIGYGDVFLAEGEVDPISIMLRQAGETLDRERAEAERKRLSAIADAEWTANTRRARNVRRLRHALKACGIRI